MPATLPVPIADGAAFLGIPTQMKHLGMPVGRHIGEAGDPAAGHGGAAQSQGQGWHLFSFGKQETPGGRVPTPGVAESSISSLAGHASVIHVAPQALLPSMVAAPGLIGRSTSSLRTCSRSFTPPTLCHGHCRQESQNGLPWSDIATPGRHTSRDRWRFPVHVVVDVVAVGCLDQPPAGGDIHVLIRLHGHSPRGRSLGSWQLRNDQMPARSEPASVTQPLYRNSSW